MTPYTCPTCHRYIQVERCVRASNSPGDHYHAYHVAQAYHRERVGRCESCSKSWPCPTIVEFA